jgi:XapX domain-containing protein
VGAIYGLLDVRSPGPPVVALLGLLGMLIGEQIVPIAKRVIAGEKLRINWLKSECGDHVFGTLPTRLSIRLKRPRRRRVAVITPTLHSACTR